MAAISMKTMAAALLANAASTGTALSLSTANVQALAAMCDQLAKNPGFFHPVHMLVNDTHKAQITSAQ